MVVLKPGLGFQQALATRSVVFDTLSAHDVKHACGVWQEGDTNILFDVNVMARDVEINPGPGNILFFNKALETGIDL